MKRQQLTRADRGAGAGTRKVPRTYLRTALAILLIGVAVWSFFALRRSARWQGYLGRLAVEPGIAVIDSGRRGGKYFVTGLRDPLAADPKAMLAESKISSASVVGDWKPYQALHPKFIAARARRVLDPPSTVTLRATDGALLATGTAPHRWIEEARVRSRVFADVARFDDSGVTDSDLSGLEALRREIQDRPVSFAVASADLRPRDAVRLEALSRDLSRLAGMAVGMGKTLQVTVTGRGDSTGTEDVNRSISRQRAERVARALALGNARSVTFVVRGVGSSEPLRREVTEEDRELNRSVTLSVAVAGGAREGSR